MRLLIAVFMALHGIAHLVGFLAPWGLLKTGDRMPLTTILSGRVDLGIAGVRVFGIIWLGLAVGFAVAAIGAWTGAGWWLWFATIVALPSLFFSVLALPESKFGIPVNCVILGLLYAGSRLSWF